MFQDQMTCNGVPSFFPANFMWQMQALHEEEIHTPTTSLTPPLPVTNPQDLRGLATMLGKRSMPFFGFEPCEEVNGEDDLSDDGWQAGEKKRRLNLEQVRTLEQNFEMGIRLEPERKMQLARALGMQPRQIAIWFQNRRARWKTKQLEKDYEALKRQYEVIKLENDALQTHNKKLQAEILALNGKETSEPINLLNKETEGSCSNRSENSSDINLDISRAAPASDGTPNPHQGSSFFPSHRQGVTAQLLENSCRPETRSPKIESTVQDESFCNMFSNMDEQSAFWPWSEGV